MENQLLEEQAIEKSQEKKKKDFKLKNKKQRNTKEEIFKIVLTGLLLGLSVVASLWEIMIPIMGAIVPLRIFDALIMAIAIPIIGIWYTLSIAIIEPWLHFALHSDHPPIQMFFDNVANVVFVVSFVLIYYKLFKLDKLEKTESKKNIVVKNTFAGLILVPLNAIVSSLTFVFTMLVLAANKSHIHVHHGDHDHGTIDSVSAFFEHGAAIFFILLAIEIARFLFIYILFALVQKKLSQVTHRFQFNDN